MKNIIRRVLTILIILIMFIFQNDADTLELLVVLSGLVFIIILVNKLLIEWFNLLFICMVVMSGGAINEKD